MKPNAVLGFAGHFAVLSGNRRYAIWSRPDSSSDQLVFWMKQIAVDEPPTTLEALDFRGCRRLAGEELSAQAAEFYIWPFRILVTLQIA